MKTKTEPYLQADRLPGGTVTFQFSDIEGSTELLKSLGEGYAEALTDQRRILRPGFQRWHGKKSTRKENRVQRA